MFTMIVMQWLVFLWFAGFHLRYFSMNIFHPVIFYLFFHFLVFVLHPTVAELFHFNITYNYIHSCPRKRPGSGLFWLPMSL